MVRKSPEPRKSGVFKGIIWVWSTSLFWIKLENFPQNYDTSTATQTKLLIMTNNRPLRAGHVKATFQIGKFPQNYDTSTATQTKLLIMTNNRPLRAGHVKATSSNHLVMKSFWVDVFTIHT